MLIVAPIIVIFLALFFESWRIDSEIVRIGLKPCSHSETMWVEKSGNCSVLFRHFWHSYRLQSQVSRSNRDGDYEAYRVQVLQLKWKLIRFDSFITSVNNEFSDGHVICQ